MLFPNRDNRPDAWGRASREPGQVIVFCDFAWKKRGAIIFLAGRFKQASYNYVTVIRNSRCINSPTGLSSFHFWFWTPYEFE
jgi:hypothetical protein